ncbi:MAG: GatB/YqeY domain-containing protein [Gammaproteobacteria bacterium]
MTAAALQKQLHDAMRAGERLRVDVLRMFLAEIKKTQIDSGAAADAAVFAAAARKLIKQRRDSAAQFQRAGRDELAARENAEIAILAEFLPSAPSAAEIAAAVENAVSAVSAKTPRDTGKVMAHIKNALPAADMSEVAAIVKQKLSAA